MGYSAADERFTHQLPRPFDEVHDPSGSWSDRCYFFAHSPDGELLLTTGYGNNPNQQGGLGYCKVSMADGRHWDLLAGRPVAAGDRGDLHAGPMRWTCIEPLERWTIELGPNDTGIEWEMHYEPRAPMWELLPMKVEVDGKAIVDMFHMKESGRWTGWVQIDGERISVDGFHGGRDRTFGVRDADQIDFWLWLDIGFADRALQGWVIERHDGTVQYVDGGITRTDGTTSRRFTSIEHEVTFDGDRKRPAQAVLVFTDEDGETLRVTGESMQHVNAYYGQPLPRMGLEDLGGGAFFLHFPWNSADQLMRFQLGDETGYGIFEILSGGDGYARYPNWPAMDMTPFRQDARSGDDK